MARSPLTLAASVTVAVPDAKVVSAATLTAGGDDRNDSAVVTLDDGRQVVVRVPRDGDTDGELATEAIALRAFSDGVRALVDFTVPEFLGTAPIDGVRAFVTSFIPGYLVDADQLPPGRGVAASLGRALGAIHSLPPSVVRSAGLPVRSTEEIRDEARRIMDEAGSTGRVPVRLMVRWREAIDDDAMWRFEPAVSLGGVGANAFIYDERGSEPAVVGVIDWHSLQVTDPAVDLQFLGSAPDAADTVHEAYAARVHRAPDDRVRARARLHAELEFARWLLHGRDTHRIDIMDDAAGLLDALAEGVRDDALVTVTTRGDIDDALAALGSVPAASGMQIDTSMQTDTYDPEDLAFITGDRVDSKQVDTEAIDPGFFADADSTPQAATEQDTEALDGGFFAEDDGTVRLSEQANAGDDADIAEAERAAEAAIRRWAQDSSD